MRSPHDYDKIACVSVEESIVKVTPRSEGVPTESIPTETLALNDQSAPGKLSESPWPWLALIFALFLGLPYMPLPSRGAALILAILTTALYVYAAVKVIALGTKARLQPTPLAIGLLGCGFLWWAMDKWGLAAAFEPIAAAHKAKVRPGAGAVFTLQLAQLVSDVALMGAGIFGGCLVARLIKAPNMLGPICGVVALIDIWGVLFAGPVSQMLEKAPEIAQKVMPSLPAAGMLSKNAQFAVEPLRIGVGDYLFMGLLFAALHLNHMNWRGAARLATPFIFLTLMVVMFGTLHMPGLLPIGLAIALPNLKYFKFTREENFAMLWAGLLVVVLSAGAYIAVQKSLPEKPPQKPPTTSNAKPEAKPNITTTQPTKVKP